MFSACEIAFGEKTDGAARAHLGQLVEDLGAQGVIVFSAGEAHGRGIGAGADAGEPLHGRTLLGGVAGPIGADEGYNVGRGVRIDAVLEVDEDAAAAGDDFRIIALERFDDGWLGVAAQLPEGFGGLLADVGIEVAKMSDGGGDEVLIGSAERGPSEQKKCQSERREANRAANHAKPQKGM